MKTNAPNACDLSVQTRISPFSAILRVLRFSSSVEPQIGALVGRKRTEKWPTKWCAQRGDPFKTGKCAKCLCSVSASEDKPIFCHFAGAPFSSSVAPKSPAKSAH